MATGGSLLGASRGVPLAPREGGGDEKTEKGREKDVRLTNKSYFGYMFSVPRG